MFHLVTTESLTRNTVEALVMEAERLRERPRFETAQSHAGRIVATLFYEPSTRTRMSFEAAVLRLGGHVISSENARENSSAKKGETLEDVFRIVGSYADAIIIRHHETGALEKAVKVSPVPVISAGAGHGEHPTQSLLDVYTIKLELGRLDDFHICLVGDLKYGRTVHSLLKLLTRFNGIEVTVVHPDSLGLDAEFCRRLAEQGLHIRRETNFIKALKEADIVYQTRVQNERLSKPDEANEAELYHIRPEHLEVLHAGARILHPLPRVDEIHPDVDKDQRAAYFRQAENGLYMRMALMDSILGGRLT